MKIITLLVAFSFVFFTFVGGTFAGTCWNGGSNGSSPYNVLDGEGGDSSVAFSHVKYCVETVASDGDTIVVPAGSATWTDCVTVSGGVTLQGNGIGNTVITNGRPNTNSDDHCISVASDNATNTNIVTGFTFEGQGNRWLLSIGNRSTTTAYTNTRIYGNRFQNSTRAIYTSGMVGGVVDNNQFYNNSYDFYFKGKDWYSWIVQDPPNPGNGEGIYVESNTFDLSDRLIASGQGGGPWTFRYNTVTNYQTYDIMEAHGNQQPVTEPYSPGGSRANILAEIYENDIHISYASIPRLFYHRGGGVIMYNNRMTGNPSDCSIVMIEEDGPASYNYLSEYPGYDPVENTYYYNNTINSSPITPTVNAQSTAFIQEGRNYWLVNPVGQTIGGSVYTPYQYPHPMTRSSTPAAIRLRIVE